MGKTFAMPIDEMIRNALNKYGGYVSKVEMLRRQLDATTDPEKRKQLELLELKATVLHCWLQLLNDDERFVVQKHIIEGLDWPRVAHAFAERWGHEFIRTERSLQQYQKNAMEKMSSFTMEHFDVILPLFEDVVD